jgi:transposase
MLLVGIDWADDHHDVCLVDETCLDPSSTLDRFRIAHSSVGFEMLHSKLREHETTPDQICVAIETPHGLLVHDLIRSGYCVYAINPKSVSRYRDRHTPSSAKDDDRDALALAHLLRTDRHRYSPLEMLPQDYRLLDEYCRDLRQMIEDRTRIINRLLSCLKEYYPQALRLFSRPQSAISMAFLHAFPEPASLRTLTKKRFAAFLTKHHYTQPGRTGELYAILAGPAPAADAVVTQSSKMRMLALLDQLAPLQEHIQNYERRIQELFEKLPESQDISNLPGVGNRLGPELAAALGPRPEGEPKRFASSRALERLGGSAPVTKQSGKYKHVGFRRACDKRLRCTFHDWAKTSLNSSRWARAYYDYHKAQGHRHNTILRNLASKLIAIQHRLWRTGETYDEQHHIDNLKRRGVIWALEL